MKTNDFITTYELMLGNWVRYRDERNVIVSNLGYEFGTTTKYGIPCGSDDIREYNPIPLSKEMLRLNCGFEVNSNVANLNSIVLIYDTSVEDNIKYWYLAEEDYSGVYGVYNEIKYLHQLQNLYKILTGETLKITL